MRTLVAFLQLCRFPAVFTALADIFVGWLLTHARLAPGLDFGLLLLASAGLYLSGMVFNDVFDRVADASQRPGRPIPSGRVKLAHALLFGGLLMLAGVVAAAAVGLPSLVGALLIVAGIFVYDGMLKNTPLGPMAMGACRFLNVMLGASAATFDDAGRPTLAAVWNLPQMLVAAGLGLYIVGVTWFARREEAVSARGHLAGALGVINLGLILLIAFVLNWPDPHMAGRGWNAAILLAAIGVVLNRRCLNALFDPAPERVQAGVRTLLMSLVMLDAALVFFANDNRLYAIAVVLLLAPPLALGKVMSMT